MGNFCVRHIKGNKTGGYNKMIISIDETRAVDAAKYANRLNNMKEHKCKACSEKYEEMLLGFRKMIKHPEDEVLIYTENNEILGVLALFVEKKQKCTEAVGGVYAEKDYEKIAMKFFEYIKEKYAGFHFYAAYVVENRDAINFMQKVGAKSDGTEIDMRIKKEDFNYSKGDKDKEIVLLSNKYYEAFTEFHDENNKDVALTGELILEDINKFDVLLTLDKGKIVGEVVTSKFGGEREEIYFESMLEEYRQQGYDKSLLQDAMKRTFEFGANEIMILAMGDNTTAISLYESLGFKKYEACITFFIEKL